MNCEEVSTLISAELDGELAPEDRPALEAHLAGCVACRSVLEAFRLALVQPAADAGSGSPAGGTGERRR